jgi:hypothetical protein
MEKTCPLGHECEKCHWYVHIIGTNPQTGQPVDDYACGISWMPILLVETAKEIHQLSADVESFKNKTVQSQKGLLALIAGGLNSRLINQSGDER